MTTARALPILLAAFLGGEGAAAQTVDYTREDPSEIMTAEACGECHISEFEVWKRTTHATGFKTLHRKETAETIAGKMGFRLMKRDSLCIRCHYTAQVQNEQLRAVSGVSCESCHGAAQDWINVHNDYGGKQFTHATETAAHREERIEQSRRAGMRRPSDLYGVAGSCFQCHLVPEEKLVNVGGHSIGSSDFELVEQTQGEIRHNFLQSFLSGDGTDNAERSVERKRLLYVAGRAVELEYSLRGMATAEGPGAYANAMGRRVTTSVRRIRRIAARAGSAQLADLDTMVQSVRRVRVTPGNREALLKAANEVGAATRRFLAAHDGTRLAQLDPLVLGTDDGPLEADDQVAAASGDGEIVGSEPTAGSPSPSTSTATTVAASGAPSTPTGTSHTSSPRVVGRLKKRIRPPFQHRTLGQSACGECHNAENGWWFGDAHSRSADAFFDQNPNNVKIARLYGVPPAEMARGTHVCMDCHGTIVSGRERREVNDGVSCESCHGAAGDFLELHKEGDKALGLQRPGYVQALTLGMLELKGLEVRARTCTGCHYITEPRLLSAGHPSGRDFDYAEGMTRIRHWDEPPTPAGRLASVFRTALAARGPIPDVPRAALAVQTTPSTTPTGTQGGGTQTADTGGTPIGVGGRDTGGLRPPRFQAPRTRPTGSAGLPQRREAGRLQLPDLPRRQPSRSIEESLLSLKERLEALYQALRDRGGTSP